MRRTTIPVIVPSKRATRSSTKSGRNRQKGTGNSRQTGGHQRARKTPIWHESEWWEGRLLVRNAPSHLQRPPGRFRFTLWEHTENLAFRAEFHIMHFTVLSDTRSYFTLVFVARASLRPAVYDSAFLLRCVAFCDDGLQYILYFRGTFYFKKACLLSDVVLV